MAHIFHSLIDTDAARRLASENITVDMGVETVSLDESLGRVLATDILSPINSPPFTRSIKDGYAVNSEEIQSASENSPVSLALTGRIQIGNPPGNTVRNGECIYIPTGGVMPEGADSVIMVEYTREENGEVKMFRPVKKGENIALAGSDVPRGELIIRKNTRIGPRELAVISSLGVKEFGVLRRISIGVVSTGDELVTPGDELNRGKIYESNGRTIRSLIESEGNSFSVRLYGILPDDEHVMRERLDTISSENDILIVSGSTSAGEKDMVYRILGEYDPGIVFHGIRIKPGKPTLLSKKGKKIIIGLPGFPVSAMMTFLSIFFPYILREAGLTEKENYLDGVLAGKVSLDIGKQNLIPVSVVRKGRIIAFPIYGGSGSISRVLRADGYISLKGDRRTVEEGESVRIRLFDRHVPEHSWVITGENDASMDILSRHPGMKVIKTGHYSAISSVLKGFSDVGGAVISGPSLDLSGYVTEKSMEDFIVLWKKEKQFGIVWRNSVPAISGGLKKMVENNMTLAVPARTEGSFRAFDKFLEESGLSRDNLQDFTSETGNLNSVAFAVSEGYYPAGISDGDTAQKYGLGFDPLGSYYYVIFCRKEKAEELKFIGDSLQHHS